MAEGLGRARLFEATNDDPRPKYYVLEMFPYPSGRIHMGHVRNYAMGDVVARYRRAKGFNVIHPMGWDAFGMPAENAAMQNKSHPATWTYANIATMRAQLKSMGLSLDWSREVATCDPAYYKHQQRMFLDFLEAGLVDRKKSKVNWDPVDQTVLANEQVIDGRGWRSGALVEQRELTQWFFKITDYAEDLLTALDGLDQLAREGAPDAAQLDRPVRGAAGPLRARSRHAPAANAELDVYTTRPDTLFGASFLAVAPDHPLAAAAAGDATRRSPSSSTNASGSAPRWRRWRRPRRRASTPASGPSTRSIRDWTLPVYVANFILMDYGTGAIFGCPAHDQRDLDFARAKGLPVVPVVCPPAPGSRDLRDRRRGLHRRRPHDQLALPRRPDRPTRRQEEVARRLEAQTLGERAAGASAR